MTPTEIEPTHRPLHPRQSFLAFTGDQVSGFTSESVAVMDDQEAIEPRTVFQQRISAAPRVPAGSRRTAVGAAPPETRDLRRPRASIGSLAHSSLPSQPKKAPRHTVRPSASLATVRAERHPSAPCLHRAPARRSCDIVRRRRRASRTYVGLSRGRDAGDRVAAADRLLKDFAVVKGASDDSHDSISRV
jgi:hypothetical protein